MSAHCRFLLDPARFNGGPVSITGAAARQIAHVLRLSAGDRIILLDGVGNEYDAVITRIGRDAVEAALQDKRVSKTEPRLRLVIAVCIPKGDKMDLIIQKCTELGAAEVVPLTSSRTVVDLDPARAAAKLARWRRIACEAVEQSGRAKCPAVTEVTSLNELLEDRRGCDLVLVAWEGEERLPLKRALSEYRGGAVMLVVGPEGGFTDEEIAFARAAGGRCVTLGRRRLRTETAAIAGTAAIMFALEEDP